MNIASPHNKATNRTEALAARLARAERNAEEGWYSADAWEKAAKVMQARAEAAEAALKVRGEPHPADAKAVVRPLEWHASPIRENSWLAPHGFGENYVAYRYEGQWRCIGQDWPSLEAAKAAAQADYEARIRSALVAPASLPPGARPPGARVDHYHPGKVRLPE